MTTRVVGVVQARMGSTRLPGKVLANVGDRSVLAHVITRLQRAARVHEIVIATTTLAQDDVLVAAAAQLGVATVRGSVDNVLQRYLVAAQTTSADIIVRVTADCPLIDPVLVDAVIEKLLSKDGVESNDGGFDYASNVQTRSFPRGLDVEALFADTLHRIGRLATSNATREHVTSYITEHPSLFRIGHVLNVRDDSDLRITVDTPEDLALVQRVDAALDLRRMPSSGEIIAYLRANPDVIAMNAHVEQKKWTVAAHD